MTGREGVLAALAAWGALRAAVPDTLYLEPGRPLTLASLPFLQAGAPAADAAAPAASTATGGSQNTTLRLFGVLPVKTVRTVQAVRRTVLVSGAPGTGCRPAFCSITTNMVFSA